ncbi:MAG: hypothetical protein ACLR4W_13705 [Oscillospiraceae bacterium]
MKRMLALLLAAMLILTLLPGCGKRTRAATLRRSPKIHRSRAAKRPM